MNKKAVIVSSIALLVTSGVLASFSLRKTSNLNNVSATQKSVLFDATHGLPEGGAGIYGGPSIKYSYTTSVSGSDDIEVKAYCTNQQESYIGNITIGGNHFLTYGDDNDKKITFEIGLNNITNVSIVYGHTNTVFLYLYVNFYDENGIRLGSVEDQTSNKEEVVLSKQFNIDVTSLNYGSAVRSIKGICFPWTGTTFTPDVAYVDSVSLTWNC